MQDLLKTEDLTRRLQVRPDTIRRWVRRELARCPTNVARQPSLRIGHWQLVLLSEVGRLPRPPPKFQAARRTLFQPRRGGGL